MKVKDLLVEMSNDDKSLKEEKAEKKYVVIGNPGRGLPSALYPKTEAPKLYTAAQAKKICDKLNDRPKLTYGVLPSSVHWHFKPIEDALKYISGSKAAASIRLLTPPDPDSWGPGPAKQRF